MSQQDVETLRAEYEAFGRKDFFRSVHPDFELKTPAQGPEVRTTHRSPDEARRSFEDFFEPYEDVVIEPQEFFERGDQIVVFFLMRSRPRGSSAVVEIRAGHVWTMRDGKAARLEIFPQREKALEAAGLS
jgi:ketosteroid isomerase-like protein